MNLSYLLVLICMTLSTKISCDVPFFLKTQLKINESTRISACNNFYEYSCSEWLRHAKKPSFEPVWSPWIAISHKINRRLAKILKEADKLNPAKIFYDSCQKSEEHVKDLKVLIENLGGWAVISRRSAKKRFDWLSQIAIIAKYLRIFPILKIHAGIDYKNTTKYILYIEPGNLIFPQYILTNPKKYSSELQTYEKWIFETIKHLYINETSQLHIERVREIIRFEIRLAKLQLLRSKSDRIPIAHLVKKSPLRWQNVFKIFKLADLMDTTIVAFRNTAYFKAVLGLIRKTRNDILQNYLVWSVVRDLSRDSSSFLRNLSFKVDKAILGVNSDFDREFECVGKTIEYFGPLLTTPYINTYIKVGSFERIREMFELIQREFVDLIKSNKWLSITGQNAIVEKILNVKAQIGYTDEKSLENDYIKVNMSENYFLNVLKMRKHLSTQDFLKVGTTVNHTLWPTSHFEVNAYYSVLQNSIFIPLGLFEPPFFDLERPLIENFGALGSLIGHELSHALDPSGILGDKSGKILPWLPTSDYKKYKERTKCYEYSPHVLHETLADHVGLKLSLAAFKKLNRETPLGLFFMSFSQMWCEISEATDVFKNEEHGDNVNRVLETLKHFRSFNETYKCDLNDTLINNNCEIW